jgi:hypothetical protein
MKRKITLTISALLILLDIGVSAALFNAGQQRVSAIATAANAAMELLRDYTRPYPTL